MWMVEYMISDLPVILSMISTHHSDMVLFSRNDGVGEKIAPTETSSMSRRPLGYELTI